MAEKDMQLGMIVIAFATFFFLSGMNMMKYEIMNNEFSMFLAFILVSVGVYLIAKK